MRAYKWLQGIQWFNVLEIVLMQIWAVVKNPNYIFFSGIALTLGTMGIWIEAFPEGLNSLDAFSDQLSRISVFTFCIATLGNFATESYFGTNQTVKSDNDLKRNMGIFFWSICLLLTFYSYRGSDYPLLGFCSTIIFWFMVNVEKPVFRETDTKTMSNMAPKDGGATEFRGAGL